MVGLRCWRDGRESVIGCCASNLCQRHGKYLLLSANYCPLRLSNLLARDVKIPRARGIEPLTSYLLMDKVRGIVTPTRISMALTPPNTSCGWVFFMHRFNCTSTVSGG